MTHRSWTAVGVGVVCLAIAAPALLAVRDHGRHRRLRVVRPGVLYRSAQLPVTGLQRLVHDYRIRTIVNLRDGVEAMDRAEEAFCERHAIRFVRIPPLSWDGGQGKAPVDDGLRRFLEVMRDPANHPVLVHCWRGVHRTGGYVAVYRMECEGWSNERALTEMVDLGYDQLDAHQDIRRYLTTYRAKTGREAGAGSARHGSPRRSPALPRTQGHSLTAPSSDGAAAATWRTPGP